MSVEGSRRAIVAALGANLAIAATKFGAFLFTGSSSMLSEAIHSFADTGNQGLLLGGGVHAKAGATPQHPFGRGGARYVYGFIVSVMLFLLGGVFSLYEGFHKIMHPEPLHDPAVAIGVLVVAMCAEGFSFRTAIVETNKLRDGKSFLAYVKATRHPELPVVLLEDFGALIGLGFAAVAVVTAAVTGNGMWDGIGSVAIGVLLIAAAVFLSARMGSMLIGESAKPETVAVIEEELSRHGFTSIIHLKTLHVGPDEIIVAAKVEVPPDATIVQIREWTNTAEAAVRARVEGLSYIFFGTGCERLVNVAAPAGQLRTVGASCRIQAW